MICPSPAIEIDAPDPPEERHARDVRMLEALAEVGMDLARELRTRLLERTEGEGELALAFTRVARAVRQTVALKHRLIGDRETRAAKAEAERMERPGVDLGWVLGKQTPGAVRKDTVRNGVENAIEDEFDAADAEELLDEVYERLDAYDEAEFVDRPIGEMMARICKDLGVTPDWSLFEDEDWAVEEARTQVAGSPYAGVDAPSLLPLREKEGPAPMAREDEGFLRRGRGDDLGSGGVGLRGP